MYHNPVLCDPVISVFYQLHLLILATSQQYHQPLQLTDTKPPVKVSTPRLADRKFQKKPSDLVAYLVSVLPYPYSLLVSNQHSDLWYPSWLPKCIVKACNDNNWCEIYVNTVHYGTYRYLPHGRRIPSEHGYNKFVEVIKVSMFFVKNIPTTKLQDLHNQVCLPLSRNKYRCWTNKLHQKKFWDYVLHLIFDISRFQPTIYSLMDLYSHRRPTCLILLYHLFYTGNMLQISYIDWQWNKWKEHDSKWWKWNTSPILTNMKPTSAIFSIEKHIFHCMVYLVLLLCITIFYSKCNAIMQPFGNKIGNKMLKTQQKLNRCWFGIHNHKKTTCLSTDVRHEKANKWNPLLFQWEVIFHQMTLRHNLK